MEHVRRALIAPMRVKLAFPFFPPELRVDSFDCNRLDAVDFHFAKGFRLRAPLARLRRIGSFTKPLCSFKPCFNLYSRAVIRCSAMCAARFAGQPPHSRHRSSKSSLLISTTPPMLLPEGT